MTGQEQCSEHSTPEAAAWVRGHTHFVMATCLMMLGSSAAGECRYGMQEQWWQVSAVAIIRPTLCGLVAATHASKRREVHTAVDAGVCC